MKLTMRQRDKNKGLKIRIKLKKVSEQASRASLPAAPLSRIAADPNLNVAGDRRGLHNRENPPSSERMKKIRAMRRFYSKAMPVLQCSACAFSSQCPQYRAGYECAFLPFLNSHKIETVEDMMFYMKELVGSNMRRAHLATLMETMTGASPSLETSEALNLAFEQLQKLHERSTEGGSTLEINDPDGTIIGRLFGGVDGLLASTKEARNAVIDVHSSVQQVDSLMPSETDLKVLAGKNVNTEVLRDSVNEQNLLPAKKVAATVTVTDAK